MEKTKKESLREIIDVLENMNSNIDGLYFEVSGLRDNVLTEENTNFIKGMIDEIHQELDNILETIDEGYEKASMFKNEEYSLDPRSFASELLHDHSEDIVLASYRTTLDEWKPLNTLPYFVIEVTTSSMNVTYHYLMDDGGIGMDGQSFTYADMASKSTDAIVNIIDNAMVEMASVNQRFSEKTIRNMLFVLTYKLTLPGEPEYRLSSLASTNGTWSIVDMIRRSL